MAKKTRKSAKTPAKKKLLEKKMLDIPNYAQTEEFTSSAACALMALKYINNKTQMKKDNEFDIWQTAVNGSVWHGSRYGLAYAIAKRGGRTQITSNVKDEGYEKKLAVYEGINLDTLTASFNEIRDKSRSMKIKENYGAPSINLIKKALNGNKIPIVLVNAKTINPYRESSPQWVVVKGYDKDTFHINDSYSDSVVTMEPDAFKAALGYENEFHMITVDAKKR